MSLFGPAWADHTSQIARNWRSLVAKEDLVLIAGDISWALRPEEAKADLEWIDALPGKKLLIKGNHDYWWPSSKKLQALLPPTISFIYNSAFHWNDVSIGGARLWDTEEYSFGVFADYKPNPKKNQESPPPKEEGERIFQRELERLELSLKQMDRHAKHKIAMTHYPPIGANLAPSRASSLLEHYGIDTVIFGHLHSLKKESLPLFGTARGVRYILTSCDLIDFTPIRIL